MADEPDQPEVELEDAPIEEAETPDLVPEGADDGEPDVQPEDEDSWEVEVEGLDVEDDLADNPEDTPAIRQMRKRLRDATRESRDKDRRIAELAQGSAAPEVEIGEEPTLESCGWDDEEFKRQLRDYDKRKDAVEDRKKTVQKQAEEGQRQFDQAYSAYREKASALRVSNYDDIEKDIAASFPQVIQNFIIQYVDNAPGLILALNKHPAVVEEIAEKAKTDPMAAMLRLRDMSKGVKMVQRRKGPEPDKPLRGSAPVARQGADKKLQQLEAEAEKTRDRSKLIAYRAQLKEKAK